jgi:hypothetical protein
LIVVAAEMAVEMVVEVDVAMDVVDAAKLNLEKNYQ